MPAMMRRLRASPERPWRIAFAEGLLSAYLERPVRRVADRLRVPQAPDMVAKLREEAVATRIQRAVLRSRSMRIG